MFQDLGRDNRLLMVALVIWALGEGLWLNIRQLYLVELGAAPEQVGIALAIEAVVRGMLPLPAGYVADRIGPHRLMIASFVLGIAGPAVMALAHSWAWVVPGLVVYAASSFAVPAINAYALLSLPDRDAPGIASRAVSTVFAAYYAGLIISPWVGGIIAEAYSIRMTLWIASIVFLLSTLVVLQTRAVSPQPRPTGEHPTELLRDKRFLSLTGFYILALLTVQIGFPLAPNYVQEVRGFSFQQIGLLLSLLSAGTVAVNMILGRVSMRWNFAGVLVVNWLALLILWRIPGFAGNMLAFFLLGGLGTARVLATAGLAVAVHPHNRAFAFGIFESLLSLQMALAAWIAGGLYSLTTGHRLPFLVGLLTAPLAIVLWFVLRLGRYPALAHQETRAAASLD